jgi:hypothetical protein
MANPPLSEHPARADRFFIAAAVFHLEEISNEIGPYLSSNYRRSIQADRFFTVIKRLVSEEGVRLGTQVPSK